MRAQSARSGAGILRPLSVCVLVVVVPLELARGGEVLGVTAGDGLTGTWSRASRIA